MGASEALTRPSPTGAAEPLLPAFVDEADPAAVLRDSPYRAMPTAAALENCAT
jgi:hypothetical protein